MLALQIYKLSLIFNGLRKIVCKRYFLERFFCFTDLFFNFIMIIYQQKKNAMKLKKGLLFSWISLFSLLSHAQDFSYQQFTLIGYSIDLSDDFQEAGEKLAQTLDNTSYPDKLQGFFAHQTYSQLVRLFEKELNIYVLPVNSLGKKARYDDLGYPEISIQKAIREGSTKYFLKVDVNIQLDNQSMKVKGYNPADGYAQPVVAINVSLYNTKGYVPVKTATGTGNAGKLIKIGEDFIAPENKEDTKEEETYSGILEAAFSEIKLQLVEE